MTAGLGIAGTAFGIVSALLDDHGNEVTREPKHVRQGGEVVETTSFNAQDLPAEVLRRDGVVKRRMTCDDRGLPLTLETESTSS